MVRNLEDFPLRARIRQGCLLSTLPFNIIMEVLANAKKKKKPQENEIKGTQIDKEKIKLSLFTDDMIMLYRKYKGTNKNSLGTNK